MAYLLKIIAHRGNKRYTPENTMAAFFSAATYPIDGIEFDIQFTKDEVPVVIHDERIDRTTNGRGFVSSFTYRELRQFDAGNWFDERFRGEKIPSFEEVLLWGKGKNITMHVELKQQRKEFNTFLNKCLEIIERTDMTNSVVISTFFHSYLPYIKNINPKIETALLIKNPILRGVQYASRFQADAIHIRNSFQAVKFYKTWTKQGLSVRAYNVNKVKEAIKCRESKLSGIIVDDPKLMTETLK